MKLCKVLSTSLSIVGAVVIMDRLADLVSTAHRKQISKCLSNLDIDASGISSDTDDDCCCSGIVEIKKPRESKYSLHKIFPDIKKYTNPYASNEKENFTFQYSIKVKPSEESMYNEMNSYTSTMEHGEKDTNKVNIDDELSDESINEDIIGDASFGTI